MTDAERYQHDRQTWAENKRKLTERAEAAEAALAKVMGELNTPELADFVEGVKREAAHQRERWGSEHDTGKTDADWFWLVGYLVGKALHKPEKRLHHLITAAAALFNWHLHTTGADTRMRPGILTPESAYTCASCKRFTAMDPCSMCGAPMVRR